MPSSKAALTAKIAALAAENLTLRMQIAAQEDILTMQNGAMDEIGRLIETFPGGMVAQIVMVLERHGVKVQTQRRALQ